MENGVDDISNDTEQFRERWNKLRTFVDERDQQIDRMESSVASVAKELQPMEELISEIETFVSQPISFGDDAREGKSLLDQIDVCCTTISFKASG